MICPKCANRVPGNVRSCPGCQIDVGFPNVRAAEADGEKKALRSRFDAGVTSTEARKCGHVLTDFGQATLRSKAVICRSLGVVLRLVSSDTELSGSYYRQVDAGIRLPEDNKWDQGREAVDSMLFPNYHKEIQFAALSLDDQGVLDYGKYSIVLKDDLIRYRATVFEENSRFFFDKHRVTVGGPLELGYRAVWCERNMLAIAKLHSRLAPDTSPSSYPGILLSQGKDSSEADFVEVHVYGPIHRVAIECVAGPKPKIKYDLVLWQSLQTKLREAGIPLKEVP